jgi:N-methylhydantoinase A/oxoprolinase/acetone carboxylase beta subunit/N-methylhydantoinase B/oxoprolinase/acetone carboxylase alpha subunit
MSGGRTRLAVDIGGTFTDIVLERDGELATHKILTTTSAPAKGFMEGVNQVLSETGTSAKDIDLIIHGTTLATNALIERKGAKTALIVTQGHRDSLEIAYENRFDQYDINADRSPPLVPRELRLPVVERMNWRGEVLTPLDEKSVSGLIPEIEKHEVESLGIALIHAYANSAHEERIAGIIGKAFPSLPISLASHVCPEIREYERQCTTCANAYIQPIVSSYLKDLDSQLKRSGFECPCLLMTSAGGLVTIETAVRFPIRLMESGPAGGAILASHMSRRLGHEQVISFDMGGTTAKICLIDDGDPLLSRVFEVDRAHRFMKGSGMPVKIPVVEMVEIGAGGGSIAKVDTLKRITVGPESAGAEPGPACYDRGGSEPTVTDANLMLGCLDAEKFAGGQIRLDKAAASNALKAHVGEALGMDAVASSAGIVEVVNENMANAAKVHAAERGKEIAGRTMIAFGGAAPLHATAIADKTGIDRIVIPADAGVGSAIGFLLAPVAYEVVRSRYIRLSEFECDAVNTIFGAMHEEALAVVRQAVPAGNLDEGRFAFARYVGQGHEIKLELPNIDLLPEDEKTLRGAFEQEYTQHFGRTVPGLDIEILTWTLSLSERAQAVEAHGAEDENAEAPTSTETRMLHLSGNSPSVEVPVFERDSLTSGNKVKGPAIIAEAQTSVVLPSDFSAQVNTCGDLILERRRDSAQDARQGLAPELRSQLIWNRLLAIVEEQAQVIIRTALSTTVREAGDLSAGVFNLKGQMLAQAVTGTPGHVNAMAASVGFFLEKYPIDTMSEGDVYVTNDPWLGTGHLFDFTVVSPVFFNGRSVALFASTVHVVDIGGRGFTPDAGQVYEEGVCIPILPLFRHGQANEDIFEIVRANVREPLQVVGDLYSLVACNEVGGRRLIEMMAEFSLEDLTDIGNHIIETSRQAMLDEIRGLPAGTYENEMTVDGYEKSVTLKAKLTIGGEGIDVDFSGSSSVSPYGINVPYTYTIAYASFGIRCIVGSKVPNNAGSLAPITVRAPEGSILNAPRPCAVAVRHVIGQMLPDVVLGCLDKALPGQVPAEGSSSLWNPMLSGGHGLVEDHDYGDAEPFSVTIFHAGGTGARPAKNGLSATAYPSGVRNTPVEITESVAPLIFHRKELRVGSGGQGLYRGGDGQIMEIGSAVGAPFAVFALFDRIDHPARGRGGGGNGTPGAVYLASGKKLKSKGKQVVPAGDRLILELPGGGGIGKV